MFDPTRRDPNSNSDDAAHLHDDIVINEWDEPSEPTHRSGGPRTPHGKVVSSKNSTKHGCRSSIHILYNEKQEDFDALYDRWKDAYEPDTEATLELLEQFVLAKWLLLRKERRYSDVEQQLSDFPFTKWTDGQHKIFQARSPLQNCRRALRFQSSARSGGLLEKPPRRRKTSQPAG
jgi:hypothetical protein